MRKIWIALLVMVPCLFAHGDQKNCKEVSGGIVTNFLTESGTVNSGRNNMYLQLLGTATGDLKEGLASISSASRRDRIMVSSQKCTIIG